MPKDDLRAPSAEPLAAIRGSVLWGSMKDEITILPDVDLTQPFFTETWEPYLGDEAPTTEPER